MVLTGIAVDRGKFAVPGEARKSRKRPRKAIGAGGKHAAAQRMVAAYVGKERRDEERGVSGEKCIEIADTGDLGEPLGTQSQVLEKVLQMQRTGSEQQCQVTSSVFFGATLDPAQVTRARQAQLQERENDKMSGCAEDRGHEKPPLELPEIVTVDRPGSRRGDLGISDSVLHFAPSSLVRPKRHSNNKKEQEEQRRKKRLIVKNHIPGSPKSPGPSPRQLSKMPPTTTTASPEEIKQYRKKLERIVKTMPKVSVKVVMRKKAVINELGRLRIVQEPQLQLVEEIEQVMVSPLKLFLTRANGEQERPMMPSSNVNFLADNVDNRHHYVEAIRDRDKDWRELVWTSIAPMLRQRSDGGAGALGREARIAAERAAAFAEQKRAGLEAAFAAHAESFAEQQTVYIREQEEKERDEQDLNRLMPPNSPVTIFSQKQDQSERFDVDAPRAPVGEKTAQDEIGSPEPKHGTSDQTVAETDDFFDGTDGVDGPGAISRKVFVDGVLINKLLIIRRGKLFGELGMVVSIFGMGIAGRVFMRKHRFPRHLRVEAYCSRLQSTYTLRINLPELEDLVQDRPELLQPGHKQQLCLAVLDMLWFEQGPDVLRIDRHVPPQGFQAQFRRAQREAAAAKRREILEKISKGAIAGTFGDIDMDELAVSGMRRAKPWPRLQGLIVAVGRCLAGYPLVVTVHTQPRKPSTFVVTAYDPETSLKFQILVSTRELAQIIKDRKDPDLWDAKRRKDNCEKLIMQHVSLRTVAQKEMALAVKDRLGLSGPGLQREMKGRKGALSGAALNSAEEIGALQTLATQAHSVSRRYSTLSAAQGGRRKGMLMVNLKVPRRDIGHGVLVYRGIRNVCQRRCLTSAFFNKTYLLLHFYEIEWASTWSVQFPFSEFLTLFKEHAPLLAAFRIRPRKDEAAAQICNLIIDTRIILPNYPAPSLIPEPQQQLQQLQQQQVGVEEEQEEQNEQDEQEEREEKEGQEGQDTNDSHSVTSEASGASTATTSSTSTVATAEPFVVELPPVQINREIYCRGHKLRDLRPDAASCTIYCIVSVHQGPDWIEFHVFERSACETFRFSFLPNETLSMIQEFEILETLEREIQLGVIANTLGLGLDASSRTIVQVADDANMKNSSQEGENNEESDDNDY